MSVNSKMTAIADAIRKKTGGTTALSLDQMAAQIAGIQTGTQLPTLTNPGVASDLAQGKQLIDQNGSIVTGTGLVAGGGFVYPDGAFAPVTSFTDGKQYALVATINGVRRYINTTDYNQYTMNATQITIAEDAGDYVIFSATPALFTAVASGNGFLLQNGNNYLHGTSSGGTALRVGTTQAVWTVDASATGGFSEGKYYAKEDTNAVWLINNTGGYNWSIKYETAGSFGYDREGRDNTYSTGFTPFVLYEYVAGEGEVSPIVDTSDANVTAEKMLAGFSGYANGKKVEGNIQSRNAQTITPSTTVQEIPAGVYLAGKQTISAIQTQTKTATENGTVTPDAGKYLSSVVVNVPASGITPSGTRSITANGTYDVTNYASVNVNVPISSGSGLTVKSGTTTSATFDTGLSNIVALMLTKRGDVNAMGLLSTTYYGGNITSCVCCSNYQTYIKTLVYFSSGITYFSFEGGTVTWSAPNDTYDFVPGATYNWVAIGTE